MIPQRSAKSRLGNFLFFPCVPISPDTIYDVCVMCPFSAFQRNSH